MKRNVRFDPELSHYDGFFDRNWAETLLATTKGTAIEQITFNLTTSWWATSNARRLPFIIVEGVKSYANRFFKDSEPSVLIDKFERATQAIKNFPVSDFSETVWNQLIEIDAIKAALWSSETSIYAKIYFDYEGYLSESLRILTKTDKLFSDQLIKALGDFLGESVKKSCYCDEPIEIARLIRNAIVHNNHKKTSHLKPYEQKLQDRCMLEGEEVVLLAWHTTELYQLLKERALLFAKEMVRRNEIKL